MRLVSKIVDIFALLKNKRLEPPNTIWCAVDRTCGITWWDLLFLLSSTACPRYLRSGRSCHQSSKANCLSILSAFITALHSSAVVSISHLLQAQIQPKITAENVQRNKYKYSHASLESWGSIFVSSWGYRPLVMLLDSFSPAVTLEAIWFRLVLGLLKST